MPDRLSPILGVVLVLFLTGAKCESGAVEDTQLCIDRFDVQPGPGAEGMFDISANPLVVATRGAAAAYPLAVEIRTDDLPASISGIDVERNPFSITLGRDKGTIVGVDRASVHFALQHLASKAASDRCAFQMGEESDSAALKTRAMHFALRRISLDTAKSMVDRAVAGRFNTVIMALADAAVIRADIVPMRGDALSTDEFVELVAYARSYGLEVIPGLPLLTHQQGFLKDRFPDLMYNKSTYDPRKPEVYELVFGYLDTLIDIMQPRRILIGHDEVHGLTPASRRKWFAEGERALPPQLFLNDVLTLNKFLVDRGIEVWMWGDMLIDRAEFPTMHKRNFHGTNGYRELRGHIPQNIVIADWHYHHIEPDFPTVQAFIDAGHEVVGASWKKEENIRLFADYMTTRNSQARGMIAGTFWHVQKGEWEMVDWIVAESGERFWNAGRGGE